MDSENGDNLWSQRGKWLLAVVVVGGGYNLFFSEQSIDANQSIDIPPTQRCHPSYSGCLRVGAGDYDCAGGSGNGPNYTGKVRVTGSDPFDLDRDNDGWGCE